MHLLTTIVWILTALVGGYMLGITLRHGRPDTAARTSRLPVAVTFWHPTTQILGLAVWLVFVYGGPPVLAWAAFVILLVGVGLGEVLFTRWLRDRRRFGPDEVLSEQQIPVPVLAGHGLLALATLVLVLLSALRA